MEIDRVHLAIMGFNDDAAKRVAIQFLTAALKTDPAKIEGMLAQTPTVFLKNIPYTQANQVASNLHKRGTQVMLYPVSEGMPEFEPPPPEEPPKPRRQPVAPPPAEATPAPAARTATARPAETGGGLSDRNEVKKDSEFSNLLSSAKVRPTPGVPPPSPTPERPARRRRPIPRALLALVPVVLLVLGGVYGAARMGWVDIPWLAGSNEGLAPGDAGTAPIVAEYSTPYSWDQLRTVQGLGYDARVAEGIRTALTLLHGWVRPGETATVTLQPSGTSPEGYLLSVQVPGGEAVPFTLSNQAARVTQDLEALTTAFNQAARPLTPSPPGAAGAQVPSVIVAGEELQRLQYSEMVHWLGVTAPNGPNRPDAKRMLQIAEVYAWLAFFRNPFEDPAPADLLAGRAVAITLLANQDGRFAAISPYHRGLLLLALGYPGAAAQALTAESGVNAPLARALQAYASHDTRRLREIVRDSGLNPRLTRYLLARSLHEAGLPREAATEGATLATDFPDFLPAKEWLTAFGDADTGARHAEDALLDLLEQQLVIMYSTLDLNWVNEDTDLRAQAAVAPQPGQALAKWLRIHAAALARETQVERTSAILDRRFIVSYLRADLRAALARAMTLFHDRAGKPERALELLALVRDTDPTAGLIAGRSVRYSRGIRPDAELYAYAQGLPLAAADLPLIDGLLSLEWPEVAQHPRVVETLWAQRGRLAPNAAGSLRRAQDLLRFGYRPLAREALINAIHADPYSPEAYAALARLAPDHPLIASAQQYLGSLPGYPLAQGRQAEAQGRTAAADAAFRKAIELAPDERAGYEALGGLYAAIGKPDQAVATWLAWLPRAGHEPGDRALRLRIGNTLRRLDRANEAYQALQPNVAGADAEYAIAYALAAEGAWKAPEAEQVLQAATQRYPFSEAAAHLAMVQLRRGDHAAAVRTLQQHRKTQGATFYFDAGVAHFIAQGDPRRVLELIREVEGGPPPDHWLLWRLARAFAKQGQYAIAAEVMQPWMLKLDDTRKYQPYLFGALYVRYAVQAGAPALETARPLIEAYRKAHPMVMEYFGLHLLTEGQPDVALEALLARAEMNEERQGDILSFAAAAWAAGSRADAGRARIEAAAARLADDPWNQALIGALLGSAPIEGVEALTRQPAPLCEAQYLLALAARGRGDLDQAFRRVLIALESMATGSPHYTPAHDLLEALRDAP